MLDALSELSEEDRVRIVKTRIDVIMDMPRDGRNSLFKSLKEIAPDWSQKRADMEMRAVYEATQDLMPVKRVLVRSMFRRAIEV
jgi:hypothetical protein